MKNDYYSLVEKMKRYKFVDFGLAVKMIQYKYWQLTDSDRSLISNMILNSKYYIRIAIKNIFTALSIARIPLKL
jgi:hypothetical protein